MIEPGLLLLNFATDLKNSLLKLLICVFICRHDLIMLNLKKNYLKSGYNHLRIFFESLIFLWCSVTRLFVKKSKILREVGYYCLFEWKVFCIFNNISGSKFVFLVLFFIVVCLGVSFRQIFLNAKMIKYFHGL